MPSRSSTPATASGSSPTSAAGSATTARAEDIAQEVFISALRRLRATERPITFKPWIYEIAKNACIDEFRRTRRAREVSLEPTTDAGGRRRCSRLRRPRPAAVETKQRLDDLRGAFRGLSESHHQMLVMRELEGLSYDQIGARTGMSRQMVESTLFRARRKLGEEYEELASGRRCEQVQSAIDGRRARRCARWASASAASSRGISPTASPAG